MNDVYKLVFPIWEKNKAYDAMSYGHLDLHQKLQELHVLTQEHKPRYLASFFRVGFYGRRFEIIDGREYIYREKKIKSLAEVSSRFDKLYSKKFGADNVEIISHSAPVDKTKLDPNKVWDRDVLWRRQQRAAVLTFALSLVSFITARPGVGLRRTSRSRSWCRISRTRSWGSGPPRLSGTPASVRIPRRLTLRKCQLETYINLCDSFARPKDVVSRTDRFVFETPYTVDGKHHGTVETQCKRLTVLTSEVPFPAMTRRVPVVKREEVRSFTTRVRSPRLSSMLSGRPSWPALAGWRHRQVDLSPIEVSLADMRKQCEELSQVILAKPTDAKLLEVRASSVGTRVCVVVVVCRHRAECRKR